MTALPETIDHEAPFEALQGLAEEAGITTVWQDYRGVVRTVSAPTLRALLAALGLPAFTADEVAASHMRLAAEAHGGAERPPLVTALVHAPVVVPFGPEHAGRPWRLALEDGEVREGRFADEGPTVVDPIDRHGYHVLTCDDASITLAVAPHRCYGVGDALAAVGRDPQECPWGLAAQLYSVRSPGDGGIGHFGALATLARSAAANGAAALAISPVHAMFTADLHRISPYGPSSRLLTNVLYVDPRGVLGDADYAAVLQEAGAVDAMNGLEGLTLIDWPAASRIRLDLLRRLFDRLMARTDDEARDLRAAFDAYRSAQGHTLESHARFEAIFAVLAAKDSFMLGGWRRWPAEYHDPDGEAVARFAADHPTEVAFHAFLQWQAARQLDAAQRAAKEGGMPVGIVADLAVGADGGGSQSWSRQSEMLIGLSVGAPPDMLNALGQSWGLAAFSPRAMKATGFRPWIDMLRAAFAHAGGVRIDHVLGLTRMWLVPDGADAIEGAYLRFPFDDLLRLVALESWRHRAIVIGEDLGTVPEGLPERLAGAGLLGIRVLWFERQWQSPGQPLKAPHEWSDAALAVTTTHDLPTVAGWWAGRDIDWRARLDLFGEFSSEGVEREARDTDRDMLWRMFREHGCAEGDRPPTDRPPIAEALRYVGASPAPLAIAPVEDVLGHVEQPNLPGTVDTHPNWRFRLGRAADHLFDTPEVAARLAAFAEGRSRR